MNSKKCDVMKNVLSGGVCGYGPHNTRMFNRLLWSDSYFTHAFNDVCINI